MIWACPNCKTPLNQISNVLQCDRGHHFDRAREGYVNLLPAHHKHSKMPGDSIEMLLGRRRLLASGLYEPLAQALAEQLKQTGVASLLDIGCGEGYYHRQITAVIPELAVYGVDIAKPAVRMAAKSLPKHQYAVASNSRLPVLDSAVDAVLKVFAPSTDAETLRVLKPSGIYLEVGPVGRHLWELRTALYDTPVEHKPLRDAIPGMTLAAQGSCAYERELSNDLLRDLVLATPFAYRGHREKRQLLLERTSMTILLAFGWRLYKKNRYLGNLVAHTQVESR